MWIYATSNDWERCLRWYGKKRPDELAAVLANLKRYETYLRASKNSKSVQAGFLHFEPMGCVAIDQKGVSKAKLQETRLYIFADDSTNTIHLITIGDKDAQQDDIQYCKEYIQVIRSETETKKLT